MTLVYAGMVAVCVTTAELFGVLLLARSAMRKQLGGMLKPPAAK